MPAPTNLNVSLTRELMGLVRNRVHSGRYQSASEVVREGLRLLEERDRGQSVFWGGVRGRVAQGRAELRAGKGIPSDEFLQNMKTFVRDVKARRKPSRARTAKS